MSNNLEGQLRQYALRFEESQTAVTVDEARSRVDSGAVPFIRTSTRATGRWVIAMAVVAGLVIVALNVILGSMRTDTEPVTPTTQPSPESGVTNGWVAYTIEPGGDQGDIAIVKDAEEPRLIIGSEGDDITTVCPAFSPDGTMLAYSEADWREPDTPWPTVRNAGDSEPYGVSSVVVVDVDQSGGVSHRSRIPAPEAEPPIGAVAASPGYGRVCPQWSPNGQMIAFEAANQMDGIEIVELSGERFTLRGPWMSPPAPPDGDRFMGLESAGVHYFEWAPDSSRIAAITDSGLWLVPIDGSDAVLLSDDSWFTGVSWSPSGDELVVSYSPEPSDPLVSNIGLITSDLRTDFADFGEGRGATWSPDGAWIAYHDGDLVDGPTVLRIIDPTAGAPRSLLVSDGYQNVLTWAPDSNQLVLVEAPIDSPQARLITVGIEEGSDPVTLVGPTEDFYDTTWPGNDVSWQSVSP
jgi:Tol biopolymer transport system component